MDRARVTLRPRSHSIDDVAEALAAALQEGIPRGHVLRVLRLRGDALNRSGRPKGLRYHAEIDHMRDPLQAIDSE